MCRTVIPPALLLAWRRSARSRTSLGLDGLVWMNSVQKALSQMFQGSVLKSSEDVIVRTAICTMVATYAPRGLALMVLTQAAMEYLFELNRTVFGCQPTSMWPVPSLVMCSCQM